MSKIMYLDIETLPAGEASHPALKYLFEKISKKKSKKVDGDENGGFDKFVLKTSFDGSYGRILCIGYAMDTEPVQCLYDTDEKVLLKKFWDIASLCDLFVGHNVMDFDLRFIYQRSMVLGIKPTKDLNFARYRNSPIFDTMKEWVKWNYGDNVSLEHIALAMGFPTPKEGIDGSQVYKFFQEGKVAEVCDYCKRDVETTRNVHRRMIFLE